MMQGRVYFTFFVWVSLALGGCAAQSRDAGTARPPVVIDETPLDPAARNAYLAQFPLLDADGSQTGVEDPVTGLRGFGVLLKLPQSGNITVCSASHVLAGIVATNAHCLPGYPNVKPENFFVVYYTFQGKKTYTQITRMLFVGNPIADDVALLEIGQSAAAEWDSIGGGIKSLKDSVGRRPPDTRRVTVWAFDPFTADSPIGAQYGRAGMRFHSRECLLSRTLPEVMGFSQTDNREERVNVLGTTNAKESLHVFLDQCSSPLVLGNSGSLITMANSVREKIGIYHWVVGPTAAAMKRFSSFDYTGNDGATIRIPRGAGALEFFGVGSALETLVQFPALFRPQTP